MRHPGLQVAVRSVASVSLPETPLAKRLGPNQVPTGKAGGEREVVATMSSVLVGEEGWLNRHDDL